MTWFSAAVDCDLFLPADMDALMAMAQDASRESIDRLEDVVRGMPQLEDTVIHHYFAGGMYCRKVFNKANTLIIGKVHKKEHFYAICAGRVAVGKREYVAGDVVESKVGTKRAVFVLEDSIRLTVHKTKKRNLDAIEKELLEFDPRALYDFANKLKPKELSCGST